MQMNRMPSRWKRVPRHVGVIPDGNRRWAAGRGLKKEEGYDQGIEPGFQMYRLLRELRLYHG